MSSKQCQDPYFGGLTKSKWITGRAFWIYIKLNGQMNNGFSNNHDVYSNPGKQLGAQNRDFGACLQMELTRGLVSSVAYATSHSSTLNWLLWDVTAWCVKGVDINNIGIQYLFHFLSPCQFTVLTLPIYRSRSYIILLDMMNNCLINSEGSFLNCRSISCQR